MDARDVAAQREKWYLSLNDKRKVALVDCTYLLELAADDGEGDELEAVLKELNIQPDEESQLIAEVPIRFEVCPLCDGTGTHVNPSIDAHGITGDEWDRDWSYEDRENYMSGFYDVPCNECGGRRVVPEICSEYANNAMKKLIKAVEERIRFEAEYARERIRQMEMGY